MEYRIINIDEISSLAIGKYNCEVNMPHQRNGGQKIVKVTVHGAGATLPISVVSAVNGVYTKKLGYKTEFRLA